jgi:hypothetical protein
MLREIIVTQFADRRFKRWLHTLLVCRTAKNNLPVSAVLIFIENAYLEDLTETCILHYF